MGEQVYWGGMELALVNDTLAQGDGRWVQAPHKQAQDFGKLELR